MNLFHKKSRYRMLTVFLFLFLLSPSLSITFIFSRITYFYIVYLLLDFEQTKTSDYIFVIRFSPVYRVTYEHIASLMMMLLLISPLTIVSERAENCKIDDDQLLLPLFWMAVLV